nr:hypothetical protein [Tanacetum cinerariifolium]
KYPIVVWESQNFRNVDMEDLHVYKIIKADKNTSYHKSLSSMLRKVNRQDLVDLHRLVMKRFEDNTLKGYNLLLWGDLKKKDGIFINQDKYVAEILRKLGLTDAKSASTPIDTEKPLLKDPDDSDYAGASLDRKSTTEGCQFLKCRLISWQCKKQTVMATSSTEGRMIADIDGTLKDVTTQDAEIDESEDVQGRQVESQAQIYQIGLKHANKMLSMQDDEVEPAEHQEVVEVVTTAKLITEVVTAASATITATAP